MSCANYYNRSLTIDSTITLEEHPTTRSNFYLWLNPSEALSDVNSDESDAQKQGDHGIDVGLASYDGREVPLEVEIVADSRSQLVTMEQNLRKVLALPAALDYADDDGFVLCELDDEDGVAKQFYARIYGSTPSFDMLVGPAQKRRRVAFLMRADDPLIYAQTLSEYNGPESYNTTSFTIQDTDLPTIKDGALPTFQDDLGAVLSVTNSGIIGVKPTITLTGPTIDPVITNQTTGKSMDFSRGGGVTLDSGETLVIDIAARTVTKTDSGGTETNEIAKLTLDSEWIVIEPGTNELTVFDDTPQSLNNQMDVDFRSAWI